MPIADKFNFLQLTRSHEKLYNSHFFRAHVHIYAQVMQMFNYIVMFMFIYMHTDMYYANQFGTLVYC